MFKKILIANRGEIACRIIKTAKRLGIQCVAVYSEADQHSLHVEMADEAYYIGAASSQESYLNRQKIIEIAKLTSAEAIHPGYGFLSENAEFARDCQAANICFIGPPVEAIEAMGAKDRAKRLMANAGIPLIPGYQETDQNLTAFQQAAARLGYPVLLKAAAGGGGKGMRIVTQSSDLAEAFAGAKREALASFADDTLILEKYFPQARHVEVQIFADQYGNYIHLYTRDCSIQRRYQKIIEEAPAPCLADTVQKNMQLTAINAARAVNYVGAGTIEFLVADNNQFYFMEMNTRLQVEHPVTEMITGTDLVEWQLRVAAGEKLPLTQKQIKLNGHAIEVRLYAEDPEQDFLPAVGKIHHCQFPDADYIRVDSAIKTATTITPFYDPMLAKLIVWADTRAAACLYLQHALAQTYIIGVKTNVALLNKISRLPDYLQGNLHTGLIVQHSQTLLTAAVLMPETACIACLYFLLKDETQAQNSSDIYSPWLQRNGWRLNQRYSRTLSLQFKQQTLVFIVEYLTDGYLISFNNRQFHMNGTLQDTVFTVSINNIKSQITAMEYAQQLYLIEQEHVWQFALLDPFQQIYSHAQHTDSLVSPLPGIITAVMVKTQEKVEPGQPLLAIEAMKMEHIIRAPAVGYVKQLYYKVGDQINEGTELLEFIDQK